jgi:fatty-acid desaturase
MGFLRDVRDFSAAITSWLLPHQRHISLIDAEQNPTRQEKGMARSFRQNCLLVDDNCPYRRVNALFRPVLC